MQYRRMGRTGLNLSEICLGTMTFGHGADQSETDRILATSLDAGVNFFDNANAYNGGVSETMLGRALGKHRQSVVIASKVFNPMGPGPNDSGMSRGHIMQAVEASLRRLGTDYLDLYYIHHVDTQTPLEEAMRAMDDLQRSGKVRYLGCSNFEAWRLMETVLISERDKIARFECYQPQYSLVVRDIEEEIIPVCDLKGFGVVVWSPLAGGYLAGKYRPNTALPEGTRASEGWAFPQRFFHPKSDDILAALLDTASELGKTPAQIALRWVLDQPAITSAIVGARNALQIADSLGAAGWRLPDDAMNRLTTLSALPPRYPRAMEDGMAERRNAAIRRVPGAQPG